MKQNDLVSVDINGPIATVVLNRPDKLNALNKQMWSMVGNAFNELNEMDNIRCIVFYNFVCSQVYLINKVIMVII